MKLTTEELKTRNEYIGLLNELEFDLKKQLTERNNQIINPITILKRKNHEIETIFYEHNKNYYTESKLGNLIIKYSYEQLVKIIASLYSVIDFESCITFGKKYRLPVINPFLKKYNNSLKLITDLNIDATLSKKIASILNEDRFNNEIHNIEEELEELGYKELAETILVNTCIEMQRINKVASSKTLKKTKTI